MRRRDPECLVVGGNNPTDKARYDERFGEPFNGMRLKTFNWLKQQNLVVFTFMLGSFEPETGQGALLIAPPFRHTHFAGKQVVVHHRLDGMHEVFSYNLYPGPSAKKGVYGVLLSIGENEKWLTLHGSTVQIVTPYDNVTREHSITLTKILVCPL